MNLLHPKSGLFVAVLFANAVALADGPAPPGDPGPNRQLACWLFSDTNWLSCASYPPIAFTNLVNVPGGDGNALELDSTNAAFLRYHVIENGGPTNLILQRGSVAVWFRSSSTNLVNRAPLIQVGSYSTNADAQWWGLFVDGTTNLVFSARTNGGAETTFCSAPVTWSTNWLFLTLTYSSTNAAIYVNGALASSNGVGVSCWPEPGVVTNGFYVGSESNGLSQAHGQFDDLYTYNYELDPDLISGTYYIFGLVYYGDEFLLRSASSRPTASPGGAGMNVVGGPGYLQEIGTLTNCVTGGQVYVTNVVSVQATNRSSTLTFSIAGGTNDIPYDLFGTPDLKGNNITNAQWAWLGAGYTCKRYTLTNQPNAYCFYVLGNAQDDDFDGLTDAFERLVSKTDPTLASSRGDGIPDGWLVLHGLDGANSAVASQDPDFDALLNSHEYLYGTDPEVSEGFSIWVSTTGGPSGIP